MKPLWPQFQASHLRLRPLRLSKVKPRKRRRSQPLSPQWRCQAARTAINQSQKMQQTMTKRIGFSRCLLVSSTRSLMRQLHALVRSSKKTVITSRISSSSINSLE